MADLDDEAPRLEDIARAIATIEDSRQTHVEWIDYLARHGDDLRPHEEIAGDAGHHREAVEQYEQVLSVLRASAAPVPEGVPEEGVVWLHGKRYRVEVRGYLNGRAAALLHDLGEGR